LCVTSLYPGPVSLQRNCHIVSPKSTRASVGFCLICIQKCVPVLDYSYPFRPFLCSTVSIEVSYQNVAITTSVALSMFTDDDLNQAMGAPLMYGIYEIIFISLYCCRHGSLGGQKLRLMLGCGRSCALLMNQKKPNIISLQKTTKQMSTGRAIRFRPKR
jgi:hypothetical protein